MAIRRILLIAQPYLKYHAPAVRRRVNVRPLLHIKLYALS